MLRGKAKLSELQPQLEVRGPWERGWVWEQLVRQMVCCCTQPDLTACAGSCCCLVGYCGRHGSVAPMYGLGCDLSNCRSCAGASLFCRGLSGDL